MKAAEQDTAKEAKEEECPSYQPRQNSTPHAFYTPGSERGRRSRIETSQKFRIISNNFLQDVPFSVSLSFDAGGERISFCRDDGGGCDV